MLPQMDPALDAVTPTWADLLGMRNEFAPLVEAMRLQLQAPDLAVGSLHFLKTAGKYNYSGGVKVCWLCACLIR